VVLPASGWEMIAKVRRRRVSETKDKMGNLRGNPPILEGGPETARRRP
jgi:hypothetical protein